MRLTKATSIAVAKSLLLAMGADDDEAQIGAEGLTDANLSGHDSHGIGVLYMYARSAEAGQLVLNAELEARQLGSILKINGNAGLGQRIGREAMASACDIAAREGVCIASLANSFHLGRIGAWGEQCADAGFVSVHFVGAISRSLVAPHFGREARLTTNPVCIGFPRTNGEAPVICDFATSAFAAGKVRLAYEAGKPAPEGALCDADGVQTTDAARLFEAPLGALLPMAGHKGYALSVMCELLGGALAGNACGPDRQAPDKIINNMLSIVFDPEKFMPQEVLQKESETLLDWLKQTPPAPGQDKVLSPGEPEAIARRKRLAEGFEMSDGAWRLLEETGENLGVSASELNRCADQG
ncbi:malate/lactate/ureidoglycolate dehydrogenase [Hyphococcus flavus]|uniref:Malate/lactate/ureidoglycolate dehydrogenase n=1 Tax=Hyphococcus flavus TaxID=1866326 RepID=A0AAF0CEU5_9PROT|nr:malate/lactate/ureidoglycolate dehydrogenase [Hyphococcus flavus]WDI31841.1 malate/lactate/ureidoglycolate dehydrogenase [Hyphococcus flavus]